MAPGIQDPVPRQDVARGDQIVDNRKLDRAGGGTRNIGQWTYLMFGFGDPQRNGRPAVTELSALDVYTYESSQLTCHLGALTFTVLSDLTGIQVAQPTTKFSIQQLEEGVTVPNAYGGQFQSGALYLQNLGFFVLPIEIRQTTL